MPAEKASVTPAKPGLRRADPLRQSVSAARAATAAQAGHWEDAREFLRAFANPYSYSPRRNPYVIFGFLWGVPVPIMALAIHARAAGLPYSLAACCGIISQHPFHILLLFHPLLFAAVFGALGTMRAARDARITALLENAQQHCVELSQSNTRLRELDDMKTEFLANVTHELKSPLVASLGYTDRILGGHMGEINERQLKGLEVCKRNLVRLRNLIDEILDFSRLDAGVTKIASVSTVLNDVVNTAVESAALKANERGIAIATELPEEPALVHGDQQKLAQVVLNLLDNAIKFSPNGGAVKIELKQDGPHWHLLISDQGPGIPAHALPRLFERFYQADNSAARPHNGVGLGLVIVKKIVEAHRGRVWLESTLGNGTTAHVALPVLPVVDSTQRKEVANATHITG